MRRRTYTYEVYVETQGKPQIDGTFEAETDARARASYLLGLAKYTAVRVVQVDGRGAQTVLFEKTYQGGGKVVTVGALDEAPLCDTAAEVYRYPARRALAQVMRPWCDEQSLIPLEVLHKPLLLRQIEREDVLFNQMVSRIAAVQARQARLDAGARADALRRLFRDVYENAKHAETLEPWARHLRAQGLSSLLDSVPEGERERAVTYALASWIETARDWPEKLAALCDLFDSAGGGAIGPAAVAVLDEAVAETLDGNQPIRALLGYAPDLAAALTALAHLARGTLDDRHAGTPALRRLGAMIGRHALPVTRGVLLARIAHSLDSATPLTRLGRAADAPALRDLLPLLRETGGFKGGGVMCVGVTRRAQTAFGGTLEDLPVEEAVMAILEGLPDPGTRAGYLLDLLATEFGRKRASFLVQRLALIFTGVQSMRDFFGGNADAWSADETRRNFRARLDAGGIRPDIADLFMRRLEQLALTGDAPARPVPTAAAAVERVTLDPVEVKTVCLRIQGLADPTEVKGPHLVLYHQGDEHVVDQQAGEYLIGRAAECDLVVNIPTASRRHATIRAHEGGFVLVDHSRNGTWVRLGVRKPVMVKDAGLPLSGTGTLYLGADPLSGGADRRHLLLFQVYDDTSGA
ncbi:MAG TPA: FHA domain-containing protein [Azospirillum sp.]